MNDSKTHTVMRAQLSFFETTPSGRYVGLFIRLTTHVDWDYTILVFSHPLLSCHPYNRSFRRPESGMSVSPSVLLSASSTATLLITASAI